MPFTDAKCHRCGEEVHAHQSHCQNCNHENLFHPTQQGRWTVIVALVGMAVLVAWFIWRMSLI